MTINELIQTAHKQAKDAGFWDGERNVSETLMLIVSECGEALGAHRSGRRARLDAFDARYPERNCVLTEQQSALLFENTFIDYIKDTFEDELADIVIRIADFCGGYGLKLHEENLEQTIGSICEGYPKNNENVGGMLLDVVRDLVSNGHFMENRMWDAMLGVGYIAARMGIDLERHIELKLAYNRTRPYRHNKAY